MTVHVPADTAAPAAPHGAAGEWRRHWPVVVASMLGMSLASAGSYSIGVMMAPIQHELGWSRVQIASGLSITALCGMLLSPVMGLAIDRVGARPIGIAAVALLCGALMLMSTTSAHVWNWWMLWLLVGLSTCAMPTVWTAAISRTFSAGRGLALAVALSGTGISASVVPMLANLIVEDHGWRAGYLGLGGCYALVTIPAVALLFRIGTSPRPVAAVDAPSIPVVDGIAARQAFRSVTFYKLALVALLFSVAGVSMVVNLVPIFSDAGFSRSQAAALAGIVGLSTVGGKLLGGWLLDRMDGRYVLAVAGLASTALPVTLLSAPGALVPTATALAVFSLCSGAGFSAIVFLVGHCFGQRSFGAIFGGIHSAMALGTAAGPMLSNRIYDLTGSYTTIFWSTLPVFAIVATLTMSLDRSSRGAAR